MATQEPTLRDVMDVLAEHSLLLKDHSTKFDQVFSILHDHSAILHDHSTKFQDLFGVLQTFSGDTDEQLRGIRKELSIVKSGVSELKSDVSLLKFVTAKMTSQV